jgi:hypothetical protein
VAANILNKQSRTDGNVQLGGLVEVLKLLTVKVALIRRGGEDRYIETLVGEE